jgi:dienelactone hydrolase
MRPVFLTIAALVLGFGLISPVFAENRVALVFGNNAYRYVPALPNTANDATDLAAALHRLDFSVQLVLNATFEDMRRALLQFGRDARGADMAVIYFAGHGIEIAGENWLIPVDAELRSDLDTENEAISLRSTMLEVSSANTLGLVILDSCRENPFAARMQRASRSRAVDRGLVRIEPTENVLVAYAAKDGTVASDGRGRNSPFTTALLANLERAGLEIRFLLANVRDEVLAATGHMQQPFVYGSLSRREIYLKPPAASAVADATNQYANSQIEISKAYNLALQLGTREGWSAFLSHYTDGFYADLAKAQLSKIASNERPEPPTEKPAPAAPGKAPHSAAEKLAAASRQAAPPPAIPEKVQQVAIESLSFDTNPAPGVTPVKVTARLYMPQFSQPVAAMVIISSSGGVLDFNEGYYARELSERGVAVLVVDSFTPRGIHDTITNQLTVTSWHMENDAFAALGELQKDKRIAPDRIGIMGISKGGIVAQNSAFIGRRALRGTGAQEFALHVPIVPDCAGQFRDARTTGKPIFYMLAELDDADPAQLCLDYVRRIKIAGNPNATAKVYEGAHHNWENTRPLTYDRDAIVGSKCTSWIDDNGDRTFTNGDVFVKAKDVAAWMTNNCFTHGEHVGGGTEELKRQRTDDLLTFLRTNNFIAGSSSELLVRRESEAKQAPSAAATSALVSPLGSNLQSNKVVENAERNGFGPAVAQLIAAKASDLAARLPPFGFAEIRDDVPSGIRRFAGAWASHVGFEGKGRQAMLLVTDVSSDGTALGYMVVGPPTKFSSSRSPAWYDDFAGRISGDTLQFEARKSPFWARFAGPARITLHAIDYKNGKRSQSVSIVLDRIWQPNSAMSSKK